MGIKLSKKGKYNTGETVQHRDSKFASRRHNRTVPNGEVVDDISKEIEVTLAGKTFVLKETGWIQEGTRRLFEKSAKQPEILLRENASLRKKIRRLLDAVDAKTGYNEHLLAKKAEASNTSAIKAPLSGSASPKKPPLEHKESVAAVHQDKHKPCLAQIARAQMTIRDRGSLLFGLGQPMLGVIAKVTNEFVDSWHLTGEDFHELQEDKMGRLVNLLYELFHVENLSGGSTQNCLSTAQYLLTVPSATVFMGCVGKDSNGEVLRRTLAESGVKVQVREVDSAETGFCIVLESDGTRKPLLLRIGAAAQSARQIFENAKKRNLLDELRCFYVEALSLRYDHEVAIEIGKYAAANDRYFCLNLSPTHASLSRRRGDFRLLMPYVDVLISGETELNAALNDDARYPSVERKALHFASWKKENGVRGRLVIVVRQTKESIVVQDGVVMTFPATNPSMIATVDDIGMIDAFAGGFLALLSLDRSLEDCLDAGIKAAHYSLLRRGCSPPT